jgi:hypothetical protein
MKDKWLMVTLAALLVCGMAFTACENGVQDVKMVLDQANKVASVTAVTGTNLVIVSWDAAEDAGGYQLFYREEGKKTVQQISGGIGNPQNAVTYGADGTSIPNTDPDKWSALVSPVLAGTGRSLRFGIRTSPLQSGNITYSDIEWSNVITAP